MIEDILPSLTKVKRTGRGNWMACCPAHHDRSPSLTIHEAADGRILVKCWAGCEFSEIVEAVGLGWEPWFPPKQADDFKPAIRRPYPAGDVLQALAEESFLCAVFVANLAEGVKVSTDDYKRFLAAAGRIVEGAKIANG